MFEYFYNTFSHIHKILNILIVLSITFIILSAIFINIILSPILFVISDIYDGFYQQTNLS